MIAVISEVWPYPDRQDEYFALSDSLRSALESIDGFLSSQRFASPDEPGKFVSLSFWRDEEALAAWRNLDQHRMIMARGRGGILRDYRIRVTHVLRDYTKDQRAEAPADSRALYG